LKLNTSSAGYGAAVLTAVNLGAQVAQFFFRAALTQFIGAEGMGLYHLVLPAHAVMMSLCVSGFTVAVSRLTAAYNAQGNAADNARAIRQLVWRARGLYIAAVLALAALVIPLSDMISVHLLGDARTRLGLLVLLPVVLLTGWENVNKNLFYGLKRVGPPAVTEVVEQIVRIGAILGLLYALRPGHEEAQVGLVVAGMLLSEIASASLLTVFFQRWLRGQSLPEGKPAAPRRGMTGEILSIAVPVAGANVITNLLASANSVIIPGRLIASGLSVSESLSAFGVTFGMTMPLLNIPTAFMTAVSFVMLPRIAENVARNRWGEVSRAVRKSLLVTAGLLAPASVLMCLFGPQLARTMFRQASAGQFIAPMMAATAVTCLQFVTASMLNGMGAQRRQAANLITSGAAELALTWFAVAQPGLRLMGFVWAFLLSSLLGLGLNAYDLWGILRRHTGTVNS
jgi:stage V sporulation protein B